MGVNDSADPEQLDLEDQRGAGRDDAARAAVAVPQVRGDDQLALAAHLHGDDALVPALDDAALAHRELERGPAVHRAVELGAALEPAGVVHAHRVAGLGPGPGAFDQIHVAQPGRGLDDLLVLVVSHALRSPASTSRSRSFASASETRVSGSRHSAEAIRRCRQRQCLIGTGFGSLKSSGTIGSSRDQALSAPWWSLATMRSYTERNVAVSTCAEARMPPSPPWASMV